ncbi:DUF4189 domain-containing protein [Paucidesulfovibrio longus]|uniref:DUF4189 domain-containing protein n=1 Tax=Paucidesulfovibrio longus TaxID=889 RepID=UPI0003B729E7|nr:DUF4189 domain-containing protein [Paucidesulfovibrio longus]
MKSKHLFLCMLSLCLLAVAASSCLAGEYLSGTVSNENWMAYYGRGQTKNEAISAAVRACGGTDFCRQEAEVVESGQCIALVDSQESVSVAWGPEPKAVVRDAMKRCTDAGHADCHFVSMECAR